MRIILALSVLVSMAGCATTGSYIPVRANLSAKPDGCDLKTFMPGEKIDKPFVVLGAYSIEEAGLSVSCGWEEALQKNKSQACAVGADAVQFLNIDTPSIESSCYRTKANFIHFSN